MSRAGAKATTRRQTRRESARSPAPTKIGAWIAAHEGLAALLLGAVWVFLLYRRALHAPFVYDDLDGIVNNPSLASVRGFAHHFLLSPVTLSSSFRGGGGSSYRPLFWMSLAVDRRLWGLAPTGFHLSNLLLHLACGWLGFRLLRSLNVALPTALLAAGIWLSLPINSEVVAWISGRAYSLCSAFVLLSILAGLRYLRRGDWLSMSLYLLSATAAAMSHELGLLALPLTLLLADVVRLPRARRFAVLSGAGLLLDCGYFGLRRLVGGPLVAGPSAPLNAALSFWKYLSWIVLPVRMSVERSTSTPGHEAPLHTALAWTGLLLL